MSKIFTPIVIVLFIAALFIQPAQVGLGLSETAEPTPFAILNSIFTALMASVGVGSALSFLIQLGKMYLPQYFPDGSAQNWRLASILILALAIYFVPLWFPNAAEWLAVIRLDQLAQDFANFGALIMPLFVWMSDLISRKFYANVLRGSFVGKSHSIAAHDAKVAAAKAAKK